MPALDFEGMTIKKSEPVEPGAATTPAAEGPKLEKTK